MRWLVVLLLAGAAHAEPGGACPDVAPTPHMASQLKHCDDGGAASCYGLAAAYDAGRDTLGGTFPPNPACAAEHYQRICTEKEKFGCAPLARAFVLGHGVAKDVERGRVMLEEGCPRHDCVILAALYQRGTLVAPTPARARAAAHASCGQGASEGCDYLETFFPKCAAGQQNAACKLRRLVDDCGKKKPAACRDLGDLYASGKSVVPANEYKAMAAFTPACDAKDRLACAHAGDLQYRLHGNSELSDPLWRRACDLGDKQSCRHLVKRPRHPYDDIDP